MKSLQNQYNLIKEGKGNKEIFLKEAKAQFPQYITNVQTFDQVIHSLTEKGILNETMVLVSANKPQTQDWFKVFKENTENVKADLKDTEKEVEEMETRGYNYKEKNNNNISTAEMLKGYYVEMKDPKNAEKTEEQIKAIVVKNLEKDPLFYVKDGEFGVRGLGYKSEHPGLPKDIYGNYALGIEPKVKLTGKYKSSGMELVKLSESKHSAEADLKIYRSELNMLNKTKPTGEKQLKRKAELEKKIADLEKKVVEVFYGTSDGDYEADQENEQMAYYNYDKGLEAYSEGDFLKADRYYKTALKYGSYLSYTEQDLPPYEKATGSSIKEGEEEMYVVYSYPDGKEDQKELYRKDNSLRDAKLRAGNLNIMYKEDSDIYSYMKQSEWEAQYGPLSESKLRLSEAKKRAIEKHIAQIEKMGEVAAWDHRIGMIEEKIEELTNKMTVTEGDDVKDYVDKKLVGELKKDIKLLEKKKALYEKQKAKAAGRIKDKSATQTSAGKGDTVMEKEEKPFTPPTDPDRERVFASMKRDTAPKPKKESWSGMVRELINKKNLKLK
tara:strand:+ start:2048 stop:3706 length:1659 start_codon:yes stop_codon:yes gene_type:complete